MGNPLSDVMYFSVNISQAAAFQALGPTPVLAAVLGPLAHPNRLGGRRWGNVFGKIRSTVSLPISYRLR